MHIAAIRKFVEEHPDVESELLTTSQINSQYVKPETLGIVVEVMEEHAL